ncbi:winged helix-turn-helix transcriptional regulator [Nocardiopsis alborubida]|uniref:Helix-turn-helix transcriptional regulator n=1 Tax=Nocardiopsis alborubida TaxID=146802 RepID=A0A7X6RQG6_9ACTN|nr:helix-turn-helix domain-containing protein [Nocardiopsis alborubida]NKY98156.1 helix-turn-helix transcriptional regulator [Nocardiopsis alborubida]
MLRASIAHGHSQADAPAAHQGESGPWDRELVPDAAGETREPSAACPVEAALGAVSGRWTTLVLRELMHGPRSYGGLRRALPGLSDKVLSDRLRTLVDLGLAERRETAGFPVRTTYTLTARGLLLRPLLVELYRTGRGLLAAPGPDPADATLKRDPAPEAACAPGTGPFASGPSDRGVSP